MSQWDEADLKKLYLKDFTKAWNAIREHPGFVFHRALSELNLTLEIFLESVHDLLNLIQKFRVESQNPVFWLGPGEAGLRQLEKVIRKELFTASASALAVVNAYRHIVDDEQGKGMKIPGYEEKKDQMFANDEMHNFIKKFRDFIVHNYIVQPEHEVVFSLNGRSVDFVLQQEMLFRWPEWNKLSRDFIERYPNGINVESLFLSYTQKVKEFLNWFHSEVNRIYGIEISDYRRCEGLLKRYNSQTWWRIILNRAINLKRNPYEYLDRYFTQDQLNEIESFPHKSKRQVDRMIEILDDYEACDDEIRSLVYDLFEINEENCQGS